MKLNWGTSIAIFYSIFVIVMVFMVVRATQTSVELVQPNYYNKDIHYESFRQSRQNNAILLTQVEIKYTPQIHTVSIIFPEDMEHISGEVTLYRPSNKFQDKKIKINTNDQKTMEIDTQQLSKGLWRVIIHWSAGGKDYYKEKSITL